MTRDEWKNHKEFDELSRDMNGLFSEWPNASQMVAGNLGVQTAENKAEQSSSEQLSHLFPQTPPWGNAK